MNWLGLIIAGVILLCISWALRRPDGPSVPPIIRWICDILGAILLIVGLIFLVLMLTGLH